jgi:serine/threonine protein kinase
MRKGDIMGSTVLPPPDPVLGSLLAGIAMEQGICRPSEVVEALCLGQELRSFGVAPERLVRTLLERGSITADGVARLQSAAETEIWTVSLPGLTDLRLVRRDPKTLVFRGVTEETGRTVRVRMLRLTLSESREHVDRFVLGRRSLERLGAAGIVPYLCGGDVEGVPYAVLAQEPDGDLASRVQESGALTEEAGLDILRQMAAALLRAHELGIVHGALSPGAVSLTRSGVARFGEFPLLDGPSPEAGPLAPWLAPEAVVCPERVTVRGDVWGLGAVVVHALTGWIPVRERDGDPAPDPRALISGLRRGVSELLFRMLDPVADRRPASMAEVLAGAER